MKKGKLIISIMTILVLFASATGMYYAASDVRFSEQKKEKINFNEQLDRANVFETVYVVSDSAMKDKGMSAYDRFAKTNIPLSANDIASFNEMFNSMYDSLSDEPNFKYQAKINNSSESVSNVKDDLFTLINDTTQKKYQWFIRIDFDSEGNAKFTLPIANEIEKENWERKFSNAFEQFKKTEYENLFFEDQENYIDEENITTGSVYDSNIIQVELKNPTNISMVFAIPTKLSKDGMIYYNTLSYNSHYIEEQILLFMLMAVAIIILFTLFAPFKYLKEMAIFKNLMKIKLGILLAAGLIIGGGLGLTFAGLMASTLRGDFTKVLKSSNLSYLNGVLEFFVSVAVGMLFLFIIMFGVYVIKFIFDKGFKRFIKENTIIGWFYLNSRTIMNKVINFDLDDPTNKAVLKIVALNFVIITGISFFFVFGFIFTLIYSIILFVLLRNKLNDIKYDYEILLKATRKISNGEFDVEIKEDLGVFNSLRDEFSNIKEGFEKAVKEEVKSQRMKTELISNVSHDLKTPLTSIITYVDLLKSDDITEEQHKEYLETIDRNSLRLKNLIEDLFEVSKVNSGNVKLNLIDVDIVSLIKQAYFENVDRLQEKNLDFKMNFSEEKIVYLLDSSKTYRIFENLLINIGKYSLENTRVYIDVQNYEDHVIIVFKNISANEINIDENELTERFVQGDVSRNTGGSGLGLAIAKSFTELQKGSFKVEVDGDLFKAIVTFIK